MPIVVIYTARNISATLLQDMLILSGITAAMPMILVGLLALIIFTVLGLVFWLFGAAWIFCVYYLGIGFFTWPFEIVGSILIWYIGIFYMFIRIIAILIAIAVVIVGIPIGIVLVSGFIIFVQIYRDL